MRPVLTIAASLAVIAGGASPARAAPKLYYCSLTGDLRVENDLAGSIVNIKSPAGHLTAPILPNGPIYGAAVDVGDLPNFISILNVAVGTFRLGPGTVTSETSTSELSFEFYPSATSMFKLDGEVISTCLPEPSSLAIAGLSTIGFIAAARRRRATSGATPHTASSL